MTPAGLVALAAAAIAIGLPPAVPRTGSEGVEAVTSLVGRCEYPVRVVEVRGTTALVLCDSASIARRDGRGRIEVGRRGSGRVIGFAGAIAADRMAVDGVTFADGSAAPATGTCEIFSVDGATSTIGCLARSGARSWAVNFVVSRVRH